MISPNNDYNLELLFFKIEEYKEIDHVSPRKANFNHNKTTENKNRRHILGYISCSVCKQNRVHHSISPKEFE